jgi:replication factor C subunit 3/5
MTPSHRKLDLNIVQSNFHIEITPRLVGLAILHFIVAHIPHHIGGISHSFFRILYKWGTDRFNSDVGMYDRVVIQEILKEIAQTQQVDLAAKQRFKGMSDVEDGGPLSFLDDALN